MSEDRLKDVMKQQATMEAPEFSPLLHERIMANLRACESGEGRAALDHRQDGDVTARRTMWPLATAASVLIAGSLLFFGVYYPRRNRPPMVQLPSPKDISEPVDRILTSAAAPAVQSFDDAKYAYLDHDAKNFVTFLASQFPAPPWPESRPKERPRNNP